MTAKMQAVVLGWDIYERTGSVLAISWIGIAQFVPSLLFFLPAGQLADRYDRRMILLVGFAISGIAAVLLACAAMANAPMLWFYAGCFISTLGQVLNRPSRAALLASVVPRHMLSIAITWNASAFQIATFIGPALAGVLLAASGSAIAGYWTVALFNAAALTMALRIRHRDRPEAADDHADVTTETTAETKTAGLQHLLGGITHIWRTPVILGMCSLDMLMVVFTGAMALLPVYAKDILQVGPSGLGWLAAAPAVGAITTLLLLNHLPPSRRPGLQMLWAIAGYGVCTVIFGLSTNFALSLAALAAMGTFNSIGMVTRQTVVQSNTPEHMRGRVSSASSMFSSASTELAQAEAGLMATLTSPVITVVMGGVATLFFVAFIARTFPSVRGLKPLAALQA